MCECEIYECLSVVQDYDNCPEVVTLKLEATATEALNWQFEFNGIWRGGSVDVTEGENIVLPWIFNESYVHEIQFFRDGELLNNTCYTLDTSKIAGSYSQGGGNSADSLTFTVTDEMLSTDGLGRQVLTNAAIDSRTAVLIADGFQIYNGFTQSGNAITMTNGVTYIAGQKLTILF